MQIFGGDSPEFRLSNHSKLLLSAMDGEEYVKGAPVDAPAPGLHTCYYDKFFLLKMPVEVNCRRAQVKLNSKGSPVLTHCPRRGRDVDLSLSLISQRVATVLMKHGVYHVDTFYYHDVPMFSVSFASEAKLRNFVSTERDSVQYELQELLCSLFGRRYSYIRKPRFVKQQAKTAAVGADVKAQCDLFLITPSRSGQTPQQVDIRQVTPACVHSIHSQWYASCLFTFGDIDALFNNSNYYKYEELEEEKAELKDLLNELCDITHWFRFGVNLGVPEARLLQIRKEYRDIEDCVREVILEWRRQEMPKWSKVIQALTKMDYKHKAKMLATRYGVSHCIEKVQDEDMTQAALTTSASDFEDSHRAKQNKQLDMEQKRLSKMIEKDNNEMSELCVQYENNAAKVRSLSEKLQKKEEQRDTFIKLLDMKQKEITELNRVFKEMIKEKEEEIEQLENELSMKIKKLSEYSARIQNLQKDLDKKTADYKLISGKVAQLEIERDDQEKRFGVMQTEYEQKLQLEAAKTLGAKEHAMEVERLLEDAKNEAKSITAKLQTIELEKEKHVGEITRLQSDLELKTEEIHKLQKKHSMPATNSARTLVEECEEEYSQLFRLRESASKMKLELIEAERKKAQKLAEHAQIEDRMHRLKSKIADLSQCTAEGEGLQYATKHQVSNFKISIRNEYGKPCTCDQNVFIVLTNTANRSETAVHINRVSETECDYEALYTPSWHGIHELCVQINGNSIMGSPFKVLVINPPDPQHCSVSGPGVGPVVARDKGNPVSFEVRLADSDNESCISEHSVTATLRMVRSRSAVETETSILSPSVYQFSYFPWEAGILKVEVNVAGVPIRKSPFEVHVNNLPDPAHCTIIPPHTEMERVKKNKTKQLSFDIQLADSYNESCIFEQDVTIDMVMRKTESLSHASEALPFNVVYKSPSLYQVSFILDKAGEVEVSIVVNGAHIKHSPWTVHVYNPPYPQHCIVSCSDLLHKKGESKPVSVHIHLKDSYNEPCVFEEDFSIAMLTRKCGAHATDSMPIENLDTIYKSPSLYQVSFIPDKAGEWIVDVKLNDVPVLASPFKLVIDNPPCIEHCEIMDLQKEVQKGTHYTSRVILADSDNERCEIPQLVTATLTMLKSQSPVPVTVICETPSQYAVSFTPHRAGWMSGCVKVNDTDMPPIKVLVTNAPDPEHCTALGPGLESVKKHKSNPVSFQVRLADSDNEPCVSQQEVTVTLIMRSTGLQIPVKVTVHGDPPVYDMSYIPVEAGEMEVSIMVNGAHIKHSPRNVHVHNPPDPRHCKLSCSKLLHKKGESKPVSAQIYLKDSYNEPCVFEENFSIAMWIRISGTHATDSMPIENLDTMYKSPSLYEVSFIPDGYRAGRWIVNVNINSMPALGSPFELVIDNPPCLQYCKIWYLTEQPQKGKHYKFKIRLADSKNKGCKIHQHVTATLTMLKSQSPVPVPVIWETPSQYAVSFIPYRAGWMTGCVKVNDADMPPIKVLVTNIPDPEHCTARGPGLKIVKKNRNKPVSFQVRLADSDNEPCVSQQEVTVTLIMRSTGLQIPVKMKVHSDPPVYNILYTPAVAGEMEVSIMVNGAHIKHSPWTVHVHNPPDPEHCTALGPGLEPVKKHKSNPVSFQVRLADSDNEPCVSRQEVTATLKMKSSGSQIPVQQIVLDDPPVYYISYTPAIAGEMEVSIMVNGAHIKHSPWTVHVHNPPDPQHCRVSCSDHLHKKGENPVSAQIHLIDSYNEPCVYEESVSIAIGLKKSGGHARKCIPIENKDIIHKSLSLYQVSFIPYVAGEWIAYVKLNDVPILGSTFKLVIDNPPCIEHCKILGLQEKLQKDKNCTFIVKLADSENKSCEIPQHITTMLTIIKPQSSVLVKMITPSQYAVSFTPHRAGWMTGFVKVNDTDMPPIKVLVTNTPDPEHCTALGHGLEPVKKNKSNPVSFQVWLADSDYEPCVSKQKVKVILKMKSTGSRIPVIISVHHHPPVYDISYIPVEAGEMEVSIMVNGAHIKHSPWTVHVHNPPDPQHCRVSCSDSLYRKDETKPVLAQICLMDSYNEPCTFEDDIFIAMQMKMSGAHDRESMPIPNSRVVYRSPSLYQVSFIPDTAGEWIVDIQINGVSVSGSPFKLVVDNLPCVKILNLQKQLQKGKEYTFRIRLANSESKRCEIPQHVTATLTMIMSQSQVPISVICETPSQYAVSFTPHRAGWMTVCVKVNDTDMPPIKVLVTNTPDPEHCIALGPGLESVKKNKSNPVSFQVWLADSDNEPCVSQQEVTVTLKMKSSGSQIPVEIKAHNSPPLYDISYTPVEAGEMEVSIMVNGAHIKHSPWTVHVYNPWYMHYFKTRL